MFKAFLFLFLLVLNACAPPFNGRSSNNAQNDKDNGSQEVSNQSLCYNNDKYCYKIMALINITDNNYQYPTDTPGSLDPYFYQQPKNLIELDNKRNKDSVSKNFQLEELMSTNKGPYALFSRVALKHIQDLRDELNKTMLLTSAYRSPGYNSQVGGAKWSRHMYGDAIDFFAPNTSFSKLKNLCKKHKANFIQVYRNHIHCDWRFAKKDSGFYGVETPPPGLSRLQQRHLHRHVHDSIHINTIHNDNKMLIHIDTGHQEDGDELLVHWKVKGDGLKKSFKDRQYIELPKGSYNIQVDVGGTKKTFIVQDL